MEVTKLFPAENKPEYRATLRSIGTFGAGYVLSRLSLLSTPDKEVREERCRLLVLLGHLLKLQLPQNGSLRAGEGGKEALAQKLKMAPSVLDGLLDLFYLEDSSPDFEGRKYLITKEKRNLMLGWILMLALKAEAQCCLEPDSLQELAAELKVRPLELVQRYRELGCFDVAVTSTSPEGAKTRGHRVILMPPSAEEKTLGDYFPNLKLGAKRR